jgi:hypothetical protein
MGLDIVLHVLLALALAHPAEALRLVHEAGLTLAALL